MIQALIGLGANIGDPISQLQAACVQLAQHPDCRLHAASRVYVSAPLGPQDQPDFLNAAIALQTRLTPHALLDVLQAIELQLGRVRLRHWGERCIDLDLLLFGDVCLDDPRLTLPHPGMASRAFVLQPLIDLLGADFRLPCGNQLATLLDACSDNSLQPSKLSLGIAKARGDAA